MNKVLVSRQLQGACKGLVEKIYTYKVLARGSDTEMRTYSVLTLRPQWKNISCIPEPLESVSLGFHCHSCDP